MSADERRDQVVKAAVAEFAIRGLEGTSTSDIAKRVGVSQPYLFRLFPTKRDLFIAAVEHGAGQVRAVFTEASEGKYGAEAMAAMGEAYQDQLLADHEMLGMQLQQFAACHDPEVQQAVRNVMQGIWQHVENLTGAPVEARVDFFAKGMLCNMIAAMGRADGQDPMWQPILDVLRDEVQFPSADPDSDSDVESPSESAAEPDAAEPAPVRPGSPREATYAAYVERSFSK
jgi:AcrR family transcriptional regulator